MRVTVTRRAPRRWWWECWTCHAGEARTYWRHAYADARAHITAHRAFGFRAP